MNQPLDLTQLTPQSVLNPAFGPAELQQIAMARPDLWNAVLQNPNVYPELAQWIQAQQTSAVPTNQVTAASGKVQALLATAKAPGRAAHETIGAFSIVIIPVLAVLAFGLNFLPVVANSTESMGWIGIADRMPFPMGGFWLFFVYPALIIGGVAVIMLFKTFFLNTFLTTTVITGLCAAVSAIAIMSADYAPTAAGLVMQLIFGILFMALGIFGFFALKLVDQLNGDA